MSRDHAPPAPDPEPPSQTGHVGVNDRKASKSDDYAHDNNRSGEGNDASLTSGPAFERRVHADGSVSGAPSSETASSENEAGDDRNDATPAQSPAGRGHAPKP